MTALCSIFLEQSINVSLPSFIRISITLYYVSSPVLQTTGLLFFPVIADCRLNLSFSWRLFIVPPFSPSIVEYHLLTLLFSITAVNFPD